jgi:hypothetical protein
VAPLKAGDAPISFSEDSFWLASKQEVLFFVGIFLFIIQGVISIFSKRASS